MLDELFQIATEIGVINESVMVEGVPQVEGLAAKICFIRALLEVIGDKGEVEGVVQIMSVGVENLDRR